MIDYEDVRRRIDCRIHSEWFSPTDDLLRYIDEQAEKGC